MKRLFLLFVVGVILVFITGCSGNDVSQSVNQDVKEPSLEEIDNKQEQNKEEEQEKPEAPFENSQPQYIAPLTGLPAEKEVNNRIIGVMINNHSKARPQSGLNKADIVYEVLAEAMITRYVAIYQSEEPEIIGPVRSIRPYYIEIINGFDALIVHAGSSQAALAILQTNPLPDLDEIENAGAAFWRASFREMPHNVYTSTEKIQKVAENKGYRLDGYIPEFSFLNEDQEIEGEQVREVKIEYSSDYLVGYQYDENTKLYMRYINGKPHTDLETKEQISARNILVIRSDHKIIDDIGRRDIDVYGPGIGYLFQNGLVREINWERKDGVIRAFFDGKEQGMFPGQSWTIIVQHQTKVSYQ